MRRLNVFHQVLVSACWLRVETSVCEKLLAGANFVLDNGSQYFAGFVILLIRFVLSPDELDESSCHPMWLIGSNFYLY